MQEFITIAKDAQVKESQNYALLREEGLKYIESLASQVWTDYNEHDPGVTLLEVLAYAITDLGYRTGYDIKDVIAPKEEALNNHKETFHKAGSILPCNQVTKLDIREILIDIEGIRNAWVKVATSFEDSYFVDYEESVLAHLNPNSETQEEVIKLNGLYHVVIEFDRLVVPLDQPFNDRIKAENQIRGLARTRLLKFRNFCEDYFSGERNYDLTRTPVTKTIVKPEKFEKVVLWADVEVTTDSDKEKVLAQVYFDVEQFLIPYAIFYSLKERLDQGKTIDEIFEGPLLEHGFIDEDQLEKIQLFECIHTSDLYQVIMDVPGVKAIKSLQIASYFSQNGVTPLPDADIVFDDKVDLKKLLEKRGEEWCLELESSEKDCRFLELVLDTVTADSKQDINRTIKLYTGENSVPVKVNTNKVFEYLNVLRLNDRKRRERLNGVTFDLEVPNGEYKEIDQYFPIQNELPLVYGTGLDGLGEDVSEERKGQAKQLKGYMLFFEQLLSNYLAQLSNVRHLFSWDDTVDKTYYTQLLNDIKDRDELYLESFDGEPLSPSGTLIESQLSDLIQKDAESPELYFNRRSRFLNHVISRFNEKFVEYSLIMHSMDMKDRLIGDKTHFLRDYDLISKNRGKGFDYKALRETKNTGGSENILEPDVWDTSNITGYQHRISRFLGYHDERRRFLYSGHDMRIESLNSGGSLQYRYVLVINDQLEIFGIEDANDMLSIDQFDELIENYGKDNVEIVDVDPDPFTSSFTILIDGTATVLGTSTIYSNSVDRDAAKLSVEAYFDEVTAFQTEIFNDTVEGEWYFRISITASTPPFFINGVGRPNPALAQLDLDYFMLKLKEDAISFVLPALGLIEDNEYYFQIFDDLGNEIAKSDHDVFAGDRIASQAGMVLTEEFFSDSIGYIQGKGGIHVVEHILLRPKRNNYRLFDVDVKQYDSLNTKENPPVAYPVDYDGIYAFEVYHEKYFLCEEVDLTSAQVNASGEDVNIIEPYFYTLSDNQFDTVDPIETVAGTSVLWESFLNEVNTQTGQNFEFSVTGDEDSVDRVIWNEQLLDNGFGCDYNNYYFGSVTVNITEEGNPDPVVITFNFYFILQGDIILGGLVSAVLSITEIKERALRAFAYFCDNTTCKGISNPYEFRATVILPAWMERSRDYNFREHAEEIIRLEAPAHVAIDIKWVNRAQMREFEICYRNWLLRQGEFLYLDTQIQSDPTRDEETLLTYLPTSEEELVFEDLTISTDVSEAFANMVSKVNCVVEKLDGLIDIYESRYKTIVRNDQYFTNNPNAIGQAMAWISDAADGSVVNKAQIVDGNLPSFLGFYNGEEIETNTGTIELTGDFNAGDFIIVNNASVSHGSYSFVVKTWSDTGQLSCTDVVITIIQDIEARYISYPECYDHLEEGDHVAKILDENGVIFSAEILSGTLPSSLKLITDYTDLLDWCTLKGVDPANYQPGDIVVDTDVTHPVNDPLAVPVSENFITNLEVKITDVTGGITIFTEDTGNIYNSGTAPGYVPILVYGNALLHVTPTICSPKHAATYDMANDYYDSPSDVLAEFWDGHESENIVLTGATMVVPTEAGLDVRVVNGRVQIYVWDFVAFEAYVSALAPGEDEHVTIFVEQVSVVDTCGFIDTWSGNLCVIKDTEAVATPDITSCAGKYTGKPQILSVSDEDEEIVHYELSTAVLDDLVAIGISHAIVAGKIIFRVDNPTKFLKAIELETTFNGTATVEGLEVNTYVFSVETYDYYGGYSSVDCVIYAPVNYPLECDKKHPDGTSYLAYINEVSAYNPKERYRPSISRTGRTVMTLKDRNGIQSISCSCKGCNGEFLISASSNYDSWFPGSYAGEYAEFPKYGDVVSLDKEEAKQQEKTVQKAAKGAKRRAKDAKMVERSLKSESKKGYSRENHISGYLTEYKKPIKQEREQSSICPCLDKWGLAMRRLNANTYSIYVSDSKLFAKAGIGTKRFSVTVVDGCGITTCKVIKLVIADDREAYYVDVKNNSYLNALKSGDIIGYPEDPDGDITNASIILYNPASGLLQSPYSPASLLPPGTAFNKNSGTIKVIIPADAQIGKEVTEYIGTSKNERAAKSPQTRKGDFRKTSFNLKAASDKGSSMFSKEVKLVKKEGVVTRQAESSFRKEATRTTDKQRASRIREIVSKESPWLVNPGAPVVGKWKIHVLTRDVYGGLSIIEYEIIIRKNKVITGVVDSTGFGSLVNVKGEINKKYKKILTINTEVASKVVPQVPKIELEAKQDASPTIGLFNRRSDL